jgi:Domain of unknown function (DUF4399)
MKRMNLFIAGQVAVLNGALLLTVAGCEEAKVEKAPEKTAAPVVTEAPPDPKRFDYKKPTATGKVFFKDLKDGAKVKGQSLMGMIATEVEFVVEGMTTAEEGPLPPNTGHFYVITDGEPIPEGQKAPTDPKYRNFGKGETSGVLPLSEGKHKLTLQFVDGRNRSYGEAWSSTINITVSAK